MRQGLAMVGASLLLGPAVAVSIRSASRHKDETYDDLLPERAYANQCQAVSQSTDDDSPNERIKDRPFTAVYAHPAQNRSGDGFKLDAHQGDRLG